MASTGAVLPSQNTNRKAGRSPGPATPNMRMRPRARPAPHHPGIGAPAISIGAVSRSRPPFYGDVTLAAGLAHRECRPATTLPSLRCPSPLAGRTPPASTHHGVPALAPPPPKGVPPPPRLVHLAAGRPPPRARGAGAARALTTELGRSLAQAGRQESKTTRAS